MRLVLLSLCLLPSLLQAASFDCSRAEHPVELAICGNAALSELDERLAATFQRARGFSAEGDDSLLHEQRDWLRQTRQACAAHDATERCTEQRYGGRLDDLASLPYPLTTAPTGEPLRLDRASPRYDFLLALDEPCSEQTCEGSGSLTVLHKATGKPLQIIGLPGVFLSRSDSGEPLVNSAQLYEYQGVINVGDFNFDGAEDFAVQNGNRGSYGGPSYDVFVYDQHQQAFRYARAMSELIASTRGFFSVDTSAQRLETFAKSGCCWHRTSRYRVESNVPREVWRMTEDATIEAGEGGMQVDIEEWREGAWQILSSKQVPVPQ